MYCNINGMILNSFDYIFRGYNRESDTVRVQRCSDLKVVDMKSNSLSDKLSSGSRLYGARDLGSNKELYEIYHNIFNIDKISYKSESGGSLLLLPKRGVDIESLQYESDILLIMYDKYKRLIVWMDNTLHIVDNINLESIEYEYNWSGRHILHIKSNNWSFSFIGSKFTGSKVLSVDRYDNISKIESKVLLLVG